MMNENKITGNMGEGRSELGRPKGCHLTKLPGASARLFWPAAEPYGPLGGAGKPPRLRVFRHELRENAMGEALTGVGRAARAADHTENGKKRERHVREVEYLKIKINRELLRKTGTKPARRGRPITESGGQQGE